MGTFDTSGFKLTFDDEFNSFSASPNGQNATWRTTYAYTGLAARTLYTNHEAEYYSDSSVGVNPFSIVNGVLDIRAAHASPGSVPAGSGLTWTSGLITTEKSFSQLYGYFEMKAQLPAGQGAWPAFWLLPSDGSWPPELDVVEMLGSNTTKIYSSTHSASGITTAVVSTPKLSAGFHTYGVDWEADYITWYLDGVAVAKQATPSDMHKPMYLIANLAIGGVGSWPGATNSTTPAQLDMKIDYIRAYTKLPASDNSSSTDVHLASNATSIVLTGTANINVTGNDLGNQLTGNDGVNILKTGAGNDTLNGGKGADTMIGGAGNDTYYADNALDIVSEQAGGGTDTVYSSASYKLSDNVENLVLIGAANINGMGNNLGNQLTGNDGVNILTGGAGNDVINGGKGADTMIGGAGNDTYYVDDINDKLVEQAGGGIDNVVSSVSYVLADNVENLTLSGAADINGTGNSLGNQLTGNSAKNALRGGNGNDILDGARGDDILIGGLGNDTFRFKAGSGQDKIMDFSAHGERDIVDLTSFHGVLNQMSVVHAGHDTIINFGSGDSLYLVGVDHVKLQGDYLLSA